MSESSPRTIVPAGVDNNIEAVAAVAAVDAGARAEALSWAPNTRKAYVAGWNDFTSWCIENRCPGLPSDPADVGRYLEHLMETEGKSLATARLRLAPPGGDRGGPPTSRRYGPHIAAAGEGDAKEAGQGSQHSPPPGQGADRRGPGGHQGDGADPAT